MVCFPNNISKTILVRINAFSPNFTSSFYLMFWNISSVLESLCTIHFLLRIRKGVYSTLSASQVRNIPAQSNSKDKQANVGHFPYWKHAFLIIIKIIYVLKKFPQTMDQNFLQVSNKKNQVLRLFEQIW